MVPFLIFCHICTYNTCAHRLNIYNANGWLGIYVYSPCMLCTGLYIVQWTFTQPNSGPCMWVCCMEVPPISNWWQSGSQRRRLVYLVWCPTSLLSLTRVWPRSERCIRHHWRPHSKTVSRYTLGKRRYNPSNYRGSLTLVYMHIKFIHSLIFLSSEIPLIYT